MFHNIDFDKSDRVKGIFDSTNLHSNWTKLDGVRAALNVAGIILFPSLCKFKHVS